MSDIEYYEDIRYQEFLLSSRRKLVCPPEYIMSQIDLSHSNNLVDFGMGLGFFTNFLRKRMPIGSHLWGIDYQQEILDLVLKRKVMENIENFTPLHMEKSEHPLLPEWIPVPDTIFASMCLSTFPDPGLAMDGLVRSMKKGGKLIIIDWVKADYPETPPIKYKVSLDKMKYLAEYYKLKVTKTFRVTEFVYGMELQSTKDFVYGIYNFRD